MVWTRRRCAQCGQILVEEEHIIASCPACDAKVGPESVIPQEPEPAEPEAEDEPLTATPVEDDVESQLPPNWNLGEPMHRVFWLCLLAPDRVPLATMFRSLRWIFSMAWLGQIIVQMSFLIIGAAMLQAGSQELELLKDIALAIEHSEQGGPQARRQRVAQEQLCTLTMITPEQRLMCALQPALDSLNDIGAKASQRIKAVEQLRGPQHLDAWLRTIGDGVIGIFFALIPLWGLLGLARHPQAWGTALKVVAFGQVPLVVCSAASALLMQFAGPVGMSVGIMLLVSGVLWSLTLWAGFLIRIGNLATRQAAAIVLMILLFNLTLLTTVAGLA
jgi:hypothetical protein